MYLTRLEINQVMPFSLLLSFSFPVLYQNSSSWYPPCILAHLPSFVSLFFPFRCFINCFQQMKLQNCEVLHSRSSRSLAPSSFQTSGGTIWAFYSDHQVFFFSSFHFFFYFFSFLLFYFILFCFVLFCFVLFYFVLFCFVLFCFILFCFVLFCFVLFCFVLFCFVLFCFVLFCFVLFCFVLFCFVLFCFVLFYFILFYFILFYSILFYLYSSPLTILPTYIKN